MGKRGPPPGHHLSEGTISRTGYHRIRRGGRYVMAHRWIWEQHHGRPIPDGHDIHHANGDRLDNRIENLQCVSKVAHKRIHSGCELRSDGWWKPCSVCGEFKPVTAAHWYFQGDWPLYGRCRPCHIRKVVEAKRRRVHRLREVDAPSQGA